MKSVFGRKKAPPQGNPYAQQQTEDEYERMTPYQRSRPNLDNTYAPPRPSVAGGLPSGPGPRRDYNASPSQSAQSYGGPTYVEPPSQGYGSNRYGGNQGYGSSRFDSNSTAFSANQAAPPARASGYGGLGGRPQDFTDYGYARKPQPPGGAPDRGGNERYADEDEDDYADEELTEEELAEKQYRKIEREQENVRSDNVSSLQRIYAMADDADAKASNTLANLASQGERLNRVEQNLQVSAAHARHAEAKTKELKHANRSIFSLSIQNPMTKKSRDRDFETAILQQSRQEREDRANIRQTGFRQKQDFENFKKSTEKPEHLVDQPKKEVSEEDFLLEGVSQIVGGLNAKARYIGTQIGEQNDSIDRISAKTDGVGDAVVKNSAKLRAIK